MCLLFPGCVCAYLHVSVCKWVSVSLLCVYTCVEVTAGQHIVPQMFDILCIRGWLAQEDKHVPDRGISLPQSATSAMWSPESDQQWRGAALYPERLDLRNRKKEWQPSYKKKNPSGPAATRAQHGIVALSKLNNYNFLQYVMC